MNMFDILHCNYPVLYKSEANTTIKLYLLCLSKVHLEAPSPPSSLLSKD